MWPKILEVLLHNIMKYSPLIVLSLVMLFVSNLAWIYYKDASTTKSEYAELLGKTQGYEQLGSKLAQLEVTYKTEKELRAQEEKDWASERKYLKGQIAFLVSSTYSIPDHENNSQKSTYKTSEFIEREINLWSHGDMGPPLGKTKFYFKTGDITDYTYRSNIEIKSIVQKRDDGSYSILTKAYWTMLNPSSLAALHPELGMYDFYNKPWELDVTGGQLLIDPTIHNTKELNRRFLSATHLNLGGYIGTDPLITTGLHGDMSFFGYGLTKNDLDFKLLAIGANGSKNHFDVDIVPVKWRIGNVLPLVDDVYIGAGVGIGYPTTPTYFLTLDTTL